ncbi:hypothetical protein Tco_0704475 [Tanacetum coccineum]|uniref:Uncharacterized protein n=1 Tax=Tanacetum coccineum TaxID=301880 RepID=A0ABQ4Y1S8_9ASTR
MKAMMSLLVGMNRGKAVCILAWQLTKVAAMADVFCTDIQEKQESIMDNEVGDEAEEIYKDEVMESYTKLEGGRTNADEAKDLAFLLSESMSSYSVSTGHSVLNQATSSKNVTSGGVHNEVHSSFACVTSWYINIGDGDCSYEHCRARFWYRERLKGYSKDRKVEYHNCNFVDLSLRTVIAKW